MSLFSALSGMFQGDWYVDRHREDAMGMRTGWAAALIVIGALFILPAMTGVIPGAVLFGFAWYLVPLVTLGVILSYVRRMAESLERLERLLAHRQAVQLGPVEPSS